MLYAAKGTNLRPGQEQAYIHFADFLDECFGMFKLQFMFYLTLSHVHPKLHSLFLSLSCHNPLPPPTPLPTSDGDIPCSIEDILVFCTGASQVPPLGFEKYPTLTYHYEGILATASTCDIQLKLPVAHGGDYVKFKDALILSFKGNDGFGGV